MSVENRRQNTETSLYSINEESLRQKGTGGRLGAGKSRVSPACACSMPAGQKGRAGDCALMEVHPQLAEPGPQLRSSRVLRELLTARDESVQSSFAGR